MTASTCWVLSDGTLGMEIQCVGLAEALGLPFTVKRFRPAAPWRFLPPRLWLAPFAALAPGSDTLEPPWPDLVIATGRNTVALSIAIKRASRGRTFTVQIQNPVVSPQRFDLVVPPEHDRCRGSNVVPTRGALHRVTPERLKAAAEAVAPRVAHLPRPRVAVLIGGSNKVYRLTKSLARSIGERLAAFARAEGAGLMVTPSRRTGVRNEAALRRALASAPAFVWDGQGDNPYFGFLGLADAIVVTADSVNMVSEACATGKPVYVIDLEGGSEKFRRFHRALREEGMTRPFDGGLDRWTYPPLDETRRVAREVRARMRLASTSRALASVDCTPSSRLEGRLTRPMSALNLDKFAATPLVREPFDFVIVPGFLKTEALPALHEAFPRIDRPGSFPVSALTYAEAFGALVDELKGPAVSKAFAHKFEVDLTDRPVMVTVRGRCRKKDGRIHTDSKSKIITVLIYMNPEWEAPGGRLRLLRRADDIDDVVAETPPEEGTLIAFRRSENSFHGHEPFVGERQVIQLNWVTDRKVVEREEARHRLSARLKGLNPFAKLA